MVRPAAPWILALGFLAAVPASADPPPVIEPGDGNARLVRVSKDCLVVLRAKLLYQSKVVIVRDDTGEVVGHLYQPIKDRKDQDKAILKGGVSYRFQFPAGRWQDRPSRRSDYYFEFDFRAVDGSASYTCGAKVDGSARTIVRENAAWFGKAGLDLALSPLSGPIGGALPSAFVILKFQ